MLARTALTLFVLAIVSIAGGACAMNATSASMVDCHVAGGEYLPMESGGADAFCAAVKRAAAAQVPDTRFGVAVRVKGPSLLTATLTTADGATLPEKTFSISDRGFTRGSLERFANSVVGEIARAASR